MKRQFAAALVALMLVTAGCSFGGTGPGDSGEPSDGTSGDAVGTINFYISDQPGAIEDFEHLNVTVSQVEFRRAGSEDDDEDGSTPTDNTATTSAGATDEEMDDSGVQRFDIDDRTVDLTRLKGDNATLLEEFEVENGTYTQVRISVSEINGTLTDGSSADVKLPSEKLRINQQFVVGTNESVDFVYDITVIKRGQSGSYNIQPVASESGTEVPIDRVDDDDEEMDDEEMTATPTDDGSAGDQAKMNFYVSDQQNAIDDFRHLNVTIEAVGFQRGGESGNWTEYDVDDRTVDLTRLQGDNATLLNSFGIPAGNYTKVFIHVNEVNGTLTDGSSTDVKLPSEEIQLNENFEAAPDSEIDFVYDITIIKRGRSGSYNIKPVASESGTDVPIDRVDDDEDADEERGQDERDDPDRGDEMADDETAEFDAEFVGNLTAGENATVYVSQNGTAVENATVTYEGDEYLTNAGGNVTLAVPSDAEEVEVEVEYEDGTVTLKEEVESSDEETVTATEEENTETETTTATPTPTLTGTSTDTANG